MPPRHIYLSQVRRRDRRWGRRKRAVPLAILTAAAVFAAVGGERLGGFG